MRIPGWCEVCRRPKPVTVSTASLVSAVTQGIPVGVCAQCEDSR